LKHELKIPVLTPVSSPDPSDQKGWCFPDTEAGILSALEKGATHLWANTILFASHPLQASAKLNRYQSQVRVVGQPPNLVEKFDDKDYLNNLIRKQTDLPMPRAWSISEKQDLQAFLSQNTLPFPLVSKPVRGRGSHGVKVCKTKEILSKHIQALFAESPIVMLEEFLQGEEATITVLPPSEERRDYWALPVVTRFNHADDIAPYNGAVAVTSNSRALTWKEVEPMPLYKKAARDCEEVARLLNGTAPIRIDIRRFKNDPESEFALFDINMKPVSIHTQSYLMYLLIRHIEHDWARSAWA
jgi:D-alanine-D-alanine ligase-like ATP-grasp enzyme